MRSKVNDFKAYDTGRHEIRERRGTHHSLPRDPYVSGSKENVPYVGRPRGNGGRCEAGDKLPIVGRLELVIQPPESQRTSSEKHESNCNHALLLRKLDILYPKIPSKLSQCITEMLTNGASKSDLSQFPAGHLTFSSVFAGLRHSLGLEHLLPIFGDVFCHCYLRVLGRVSCSPGGSQI